MHLTKRRDLDWQINKVKRTSKLHFGKGKENAENIKEDQYSDGQKAEG